MNDAPRACATIGGGWPALANDSAPLRTSKSPKSAVAKSVVSEQSSRFADASVSTASYPACAARRIAARSNTIVGRFAAPCPHTSPIEIAIVCGVVKNASHQSLPYVSPFAGKRRALIRTPANVSTDDGRSAASSVYGVSSSMTLPSKNAKSPPRGSGTPFQHTRRDTHGRSEIGQSSSIRFRARKKIDLQFSNEWTTRGTRGYAENRY
jgi:hypothetical protein